jgi:hypothetical protein
MNHDDLLKRARALVGTSGEKKALPPTGGLSRVSHAAAMLRGAENLDVYIFFDTTGSMDPYINQVRDHASDVTDALLDGSADIRLSMNGIGDHCDGAHWLQMYALTKDKKDVQGALDNIVMTNGGDEPEALECMALAAAQRLPAESLGRKRAVVLITDSVPHGIIDNPCERNVDYKTAFTALKTVADGFYLVGCNQKMYGHQRELIDATRPEREQLLQLGEMVDVLPTLLVALAKKTASPRALQAYLAQLEATNPTTAGKVYGLLGSGR